MKASSRILYLIIRYHVIYDNSYHWCYEARKYLRLQVESPYVSTSD